MLNCIKMECSSSSRDSNSTPPFIEHYGDFGKIPAIDFSSSSSSSSDSDMIENPSFTDPSESSQLEETVNEEPVEELTPTPVEEVETTEPVVIKSEPIFQTEQIQRRKKVTTFFPITPFFFCTTRE